MLGADTCRRVSWIAPILPVPVPPPLRDALPDVMALHSVPVVKPDGFSPPAPTARGLSWWATQACGPRVPPGCRYVRPSGPTAEQNLPRRFFSVIRDQLREWVGWVWTLKKGIRSNFRGFCCARLVCFCL